MDATERQKIIDEAKLKNKTVYLFDVPADEQGRFILFRQANPSDLAKFRENANHEQLQYQKEQVLCLSCVVYPDMATYNQLVQDFAGVPYSLANEIWRQARGGDSVAKKV
jgi:hypothetical protein